MTALIYGLQVMIVGLLIVFAGLTILIGCIKAMEKIMERFLAPKENKAVNPNTAAGPVVTQSVSEAAPAKENADELIAVITAAVAAMIAQENACAPEEEIKGFVVRTIRRVSNAPAWNRAGREEQIYSRL